VNLPFEREARIFVGRGYQRRSRTVFQVHNGETGPFGGGLAIGMTCGLGAEIAMKELDKDVSSRNWAEKSAAS